MRTNADWLHELEATGEEQTAAIEDLRSYLLRAAMYSLNHRAHGLPHLTPTQFEQLAGLRAGRQRAS
jgi:hypothetical protein